MLFGHSPLKIAKISLLEIVEHMLHLKGGGVYVQLLYFVGGWGGIGTCVLEDSSTFIKEGVH
jgi:hypothetical protein